jgi:Holliday junction DNA helicase RuvB
MEDFQLDLIIGEGPAARSVKIDLAPFTLVGATTRSGMITKPLRDRFGIPLRLEFYKVEDLIEIVSRGARILQLALTPDAAREIAARSRGTPRIAGRLLRRIRDFAAVAKMATVDAKAADEALTRLEVDQRGLDNFDRRYMKIIIENYNGGPVGVETLSAALGEPRDALEEIIEPFLLQEGFVQRTPRGRMAAGLAYAHLGLAAPKAIAQQTLFDAPREEDADV